MTADPSAGAASCDAEKIIREYSRRRKVNGFETVIESMLEDGTIAPGPNL